MNIADFACSKDEDDAMFSLMTLLITMGLAGGTTLPSLMVLIAAWIPKRERSKLGGFVMSGSPVRKLGRKLINTVFALTYRIVF